MAIADRHGLALAGLETAIAELTAQRRRLAALTPREPFAAALAAARRRARVSQEALGFDSGLDHSLISRLERGERQPTRRAVARLAAGLGLDDDARDALYVAAGYLPPWLDRYHDARLGREDGR